MPRRRQRVWALLLLCGCSAAPKPAPKPEPVVSQPPLSSLEIKEDDAAGAPDAEQGPVDAERLVAEALSQVEQSRQLSANGPVVSRTLNRKALMERVRAHVEKDTPREVVRGQGEMLLALELMPQDYDYEKGVFSLLESQLAGYYEPDDKTMYLAADLDEAEAEATLAHELVHAIQDVHYDLGPKLDYAPDRGDISAALHALAEGDAMSAMLDQSLAASGRTVLDMPESLLGETMRQAVLSAPETRAVPAVLKASLVAPYVDGMAFVNALRKRGTWAEVDRVWRDPPQTTEQLLHLAKYDAREPALSVSVPKGDALGGGFQVTYSDIMGEQGLRLVFEQWGDPHRAWSAAEGWGGDRVSVLSRLKAGVEETLVTWHMRFDGTPKQCKEAQEAYAFVAAGVVPSARHDRTASVCRERSDLGPMVVATTGCDLFVSAGPYKKTGPKRSASASCWQMEAWAKKAIVTP